MPEKQAKKIPTRAKKILGGIAYGLFCAIALAVGTGAGFVGQSQTFQDLVVGMITNRQPEDVFSRDHLTVLVLGCDVDLSKGGKKVLREKARSDMMLVVKFDFKNNRVGGVSIPRDLEVAVSGYRSQKINAYHAIGGPELAKQAAGFVLDVPIDRVVTIDYEAFKEMVDMVGGVELFVAKRMKYSDKAGGLFIDLEPGRQKLDGYKAMGYVRFRHSDSDFMRMQRQKEFMIAFKTAIQSHMSQLPKIIDKGAEVLDGDLTTRELNALGLFLKGLPNENIKMGAVPVTDGSGTNLNLDLSKLRLVLEENYMIPKTTTVSGNLTPELEGNTPL
ncbi:MAG: LCP family protein [Fimbriimonadaceae bacterium]|nr:LCP family protein [Fimbriimonadaceae bacterium]